MGEVTFGSRSWSILAISECVRLCSWVWVVSVLIYETCLAAVPDCSSIGLSMTGEAEKETLTYKRLGLIVVIVHGPQIVESHRTYHLVRTGKDEMATFT